MKIPIKYIESTHIVVVKLPIEWIINGYSAFAQMERPIIKPPKGFTQKEYDEYLDDPSHDEGHPSDLDWKW